MRLKFTLRMVTHPTFDLKPEASSHGVVGDLVRLKIDARVLRSSMIIKSSTVIIHITASVIVI